MTVGLQWVFPFLEYMVIQESQHRDIHAIVCDVDSIMERLLNFRNVHCETEVAPDLFEHPGHSGIPTRDEIMGSYAHR